MDKDEDFDDSQKSEVALKMQKARRNLIQEILLTEESYVNDLKSCVDVFLQPKDEEKVAVLFLLNWLNLLFYCLYLM